MLKWSEMVEWSGGLRRWMYGDGVNKVVMEWCSPKNMGGGYGGPIADGW